MTNQTEINLAVWTTKFINDLPDTAFAVIKPGGKKDEEGKTVPRDLRYLPHHTSSVKDGLDNKTVDIPHLRNALARLPQAALTPEEKATASKHLGVHAKALGVGVQNSKYEGSEGERKGFVVTLARQDIKWTKGVEGLKVEGELLSEGTYTDSNGLTVRYTKEFLLNAYKTALYKPIAHGEHGYADPVGNVFQVDYSNGVALYKGLVFDPDAIQEVENEKVGNSIEAKIHTIWDAANGVWVALDGEISQVNILDNPACPSCRITETKIVTLSKNNGGRDMTNEKDDDKKLIETLQTALSEAGVKEEKTISELVKVVLSTIDTQTKNATIEVDGKLKEQMNKLTEQVTTLSGDVKKWQDKYAKLEKDTQKVELSSIVGKIQEVDKEFKLEDLTDGIKEFGAQKVILSKYLGQMEKLKDKQIKLSITKEDIDVQNKKKVDDVCLSTFGKTYAQIIPGGGDS